MSEGSTSHLDLREFFRVLGRRKLLVALPWLVAIAGGVAAAYLLPPVYFSRVSMSYEDAQVSGDLGDLVPGGRPKQMAEFMRRQLQKTNFLRGVIGRAGVIGDEASRAQALESADMYAHLKTDDAKVEAFYVDHLRDGRVTIKSERGFYEITVADDRPDRAQRIAKTISDMFVELSESGQIEVLRTKQRFYEAQLDSLRNEMNARQAALERFERQSLGREGGIVNAGNLVQAQSMLERTDLDLTEQRQRVRTLRQQISGKVLDGDVAKLASGEINDLVDQLEGLERQLVAAQLGAGSEGSDDGAVRQVIARKVAEIEQALGRAAAAYFPGIPPETRDAMVQVRLAELDRTTKQARREYLDGIISSYRNNLAATPDREHEHQRLQREAESARDDFQRTQTEWSNAKIAEDLVNAGLTGRFEVLEEATFPRKPGKPNKVMLILLAVVLGGLIGVGSALVAEQHDQSVKNAEDVENLLGLPVLGALPRVEELQRTRRRRSGGSVPKLGPVVGGRDGLLQRLKVESPLGLEFRRLYLKLAKSRGRSMPRTLLVTSSTRGEGKTTTSACLGITLARELRDKLLLVDFDLRSPALHRSLGLPGSSWGLAHILKQRKFDERFVRSTVIPHLDFLPAGRSERPVGELIDSENVEWFLHEVKERYQWVLIDSAPTLAVPDPLILGRAVDGVLYVIKAGATMRKAAEYGVKVQREARDNLLGVLLNDAGEILPHYYGYHDAYGDGSEEAEGAS